MNTRFENVVGKKVNQILFCPVPQSSQLVCVVFLSILLTETLIECLCRYVEYMNCIAPFYNLESSQLVCIVFFNPAADLLYVAYINCIASFHNLHNMFVSSHFVNVFVFDSSSTLDDVNFRLQPLGLVRCTNRKCEQSWRQRLLGHEVSRIAGCSFISVFQDLLLGDE